MILSIRVNLAYSTTQPCDALLQIEAARCPGQSVASSDLLMSGISGQTRRSAQDGIGERIWLSIDEALDCRYTARVEVTRPAAVVAGLPSIPLADLPDETLKHLLPSRYCHPERVLDLISEQFSALQGGNFVAAARDWIEANITYTSGASNAGTEAHHTLSTRQGVCRDYSHVLITLCRAAGIPARMVSCYAPDVTPQDFHAVTEVYLSGGWHLVDSTGMATADSLAVIGVGRDAADVSFLTAYGLLDFQKQDIAVARVDGSV